MAKWRDAAGQHQRVLGKAWKGRGRPTPGHLTKQGAQRELDAILADARRGQLVAPLHAVGGVIFADAAAEWLRYVEHDRKRRPSTVRDYRIVVESVLLPTLGDSTSTSSSCRMIRKRSVTRSTRAGGTIEQKLLRALPAG